MDKISIITTFYNAEQFVLNAIHSVYQQTIDSTFCIEYVLVDDKSKDRTREMIEGYIERANKVAKRPNFTWKLVEPEHNLGCGGARKFGIENATGDYFMFLDADDYYIHKDFVMRAHKEIKAEKCDVVEFGIVYNQQNGSSSNSASPRKLVITDKHLMQMALFKDNLIKFNVWSKIYTRKIVESYEYSDERTFEDVRTIPVWISNCDKVVIMPSVEVNYRAASNSIIRDNWVETRIGTITAIASHFERFKNDYELLKAMYTRSMIDIEALLSNHSSENEGFNEMSRLNTYMLSYLFPNSYKEKTYHIENDVEVWKANEMYGKPPKEEQAKPTPPKTEHMPNLNNLGV